MTEIEMVRKAFEIEEHETNEQAQLWIAAIRQSV